MAISHRVCYPPRPIDLTQCPPISIRHRWRSCFGPHTSLQAEKIDLETCFRRWNHGYPDCDLYLVLVGKLSPKLKNHSADTSLLNYEKLLFYYCMNKLLITEYCTLCKRYWQYWNNTKKIGDSVWPNTWMPSLTTG